MCTVVGGSDQISYPLLSNKTRGIEGEVWNSCIEAGVLYSVLKGPNERTGFLLLSKFKVGMELILKGIKILRSN